MKALKTEEILLSDDDFYPCSDGKPMSDNTRQYEWIVRIREGLEFLFRDDPGVFVAADLLWYPTEGDRHTRAAPDVMVALGRPKGHRGSYLQWREGGIAPQAVFEILSPGNRAGEMRAKLAFYERHGAEEYYVYDPDRNRFEVRMRLEDRLRRIENARTWTSPRLGIRFEFDEDLNIFHPDGEKFLTPLEDKRLARQDRAWERERADQERQRADQAELEKTQERKRAELERQRLIRLNWKRRRKENGLNWKDSGLIRLNWKRHRKDSGLNAWLRNSGNWELIPETSEQAHRQNFPADRPARFLKPRRSYLHLLNSFP